MSSVSSFAWQALERISAPDLNHWFKAGTLEVSRIAFDIGVAVAQWQEITWEGFGVLDERLRCYRPSYADYATADFEECLNCVVAAARGAGKAAGILVRDPAEQPQRLNQGFTHLAVQSDLALLRDAFRTIIQTTEAILP